MSHFFRLSGSLFLALSLTTLLHPIAAKGQHVSGGRHKNDSVPPPPHYPPPTDSMIRERLVRLALQGPQYTASGHQVQYGEAQLSTVKRSWLNLLAVSVNYNNLSFQKQVPGGYVYPKYFLGVTIPIGVIFTLPPQIKGARENLAVYEDNQADLARSIKADVLSKYLTYKNYGQLILLENTVVVDQQTAFSQVEKKFKEGSVTIDQYNLANRAYSDEMVKKLNLQLNQDLVKVAIERLIGTDLENVMR